MPALDVHPPHEPIHSWRDFFLHLATITVGLLIALGLEAAVESLHHRHVVEVARENIHKEIERNHNAATGNLTNVDANKKSMQADLDQLRILRKDPTTKGLSTSYAFIWSSFNESAWLSARDSGALTYMPIDEVQRYADLYNQQEIVTSQAITIFASEIEVAAPFMTEPDGTLTRDQIQGVIHGTAITFSRLYALQQIIVQLDHSYVEILKQ